MLALRSRSGIREVNVKRGSSFLFLLILHCSSVFSFGQAWAGIIARSRAVDWSQAGVVGGIPSGRWTQCGSAIAAGASAAAINSALAACGKKQYVQLGAGTFNLSAGIIFANKSNVELRGMGANQTFLVFTGTGGCSGVSAVICLASQDVNYWGAPSNLANWTAGYFVGTTTLTLSSKTNLALGTPLTLDQANDTTDSGDIFVCYAPAGICSSNGDDGGFLRAGRSQEQVVTVTSISGSGPYTIGVTPGLYMPNWASAKSPQAWWPTTPIANSGVQNLSVDSTNAKTMTSVQFFNCNGCWVRGIRSISPGRSHVMCWQSPHSTVEDSYFYRTTNQTSSSYAVELANASDSLLQNNISQQVSTPWVWSGTCSGCVQAYNFDIDDIFDSGGRVYNYQQQGSYPHSVGDDTTLLEGNQGAGLYSDNFHGTHHFITAFRNLWNGYQRNNGNDTAGGLFAVSLNAFSRFYNIVGNVMGSPALPFKNYQRNPANSGSVGVNTAVVVNGIGNGVQNDTNTPRTAMFWGNYDTVTAAVRWCGNSSNPGWSTTCSSTSEVPSGIANFANPVPTSTTLPASFYLSARPPWWPSAKPWPAIGPDVTGGNIAGYAGHAYSIPAADCYSNAMGGSPDGTGSVLSFNPAACYVSTSDASPKRPSGLSAVAN
jgi:hypothetical protein